MNSITTIPSKDYKSAEVPLLSLLYPQTKQHLLKIADKLDLYVSPNISKDKMAIRLADGIIDNPIEVVTRLSKPELQLLHELVEAGTDSYVMRKKRKTYYMLQKLCLVATYENILKDEWWMIIPDAVRESLAKVYRSYYDLAIQGQKGLTAKQLRMVSMMRSLLGHDDFSIIGNSVINHRPKE